MSSGAPRFACFVLVLLGACDDAQSQNGPDGGQVDVVVAFIDAQADDAGALDAPAGHDSLVSCQTSNDAGVFADFEAVPNWPAPVPYGLDQLPATTTCLPLPKPTGASNDPFPQTLAATGCFELQDLRQAVPGPIPYDVNAPLWSDGASKRRWMVLPAGGKIRVAADGDFDFPIGTMLLKSFELDGKMLETRFLIRHDDGEWAGYAYVWQEDGSNVATLLGPASQSRNIGFETWIFPSRESCLSCHTSAAGRSLGLELGQLNRDFLYPGNRRANQIATLTHLGLFESNPGSPETLPRYANPALAATGDLAQRARAYLHSNCSHCHRPGGLQGEGEPVTLDLRHDLLLEQTNLLNLPPVRGEFGIPGVLLVKPGAAMQSMLVVRMNITVANVRMPAIGSTVVDSQGVGLVSAWIDSLNACP